MGHHVRAVVLGECYKPLNSTPESKVCKFLLWYPTRNTDLVHIERTSHIELCMDSLLFVSGIKNIHNSYNAAFSCQIEWQRVRHTYHSVIWPHIDGLVLRIRIISRLCPQFIVYFYVKTAIRLTTEEMSIARTGSGYVPSKMSINLWRLIIIITIKIIITMD